MSSAMYWNGNGPSIIPMRHFCIRSIATRRHAQEPGRASNSSGRRKKQHSYVVKSRGLDDGSHRGTGTKSRDRLSFLESLLRQVQSSASATYPIPSSQVHVAGLFEPALLQGDRPYRLASCHLYLFPAQD